MLPRFAAALLCALLGFTLAAPPVSALNRIAIDGIHGQQNLNGVHYGPDLPAIYPETRFTMFGVERLPIYEMIAEGSTAHTHYDTVRFAVPAGAPVLYLHVGGHTVYPPDPAWAYPFLSLVLPDESTMSGEYGFTHLDSPPAGDYTLYISHSDGTFPYQIGTGPHVWDIYPLDDYDALLDFHNDMYAYWSGVPPHRTAADYSAIDSAIARGMGIGLFYDCSEPIADKPIIRLRGLAAGGATVRIDVPGRLTLALPEPTFRKPLEWQIRPTTGEVELDYEVQLRQPLNFVWSIPGSGIAENRSWATVHDLQLISFESGQGYRIQPVGTLLPGASGPASGAAKLSFAAAYADLDRLMRAQAAKAGLTDEEISSFFTRCNWPLRILSRVSAEPGQLALYYLDGADYDALFPQLVTPVPAETKRVLWVHSFVPERVGEPAGVHPRWATTTQPARGDVGEYHEYGALREYYGGDPLDDMDAWGWHFYDEPLLDTTNPGYVYPEWGLWGSILFHTPGASPLTAELLAGVTAVNGEFTGPILAPPEEVVLSGDDDTYCDPWAGPCPYPQGSYPPVLVAREVVSGARIIGAGDICFLDTLADNVQLGHNIWNALHGTHTENVPDIDIPDAIVDYTLTEGQTGASTMWIHNRGDAQLQCNGPFAPPQVAWLTVEGDLPRSISPNDSISFTLHWSGVGLTPGYYVGWWELNSDDPNEDSVRWPVRLHVLPGSAVDPNQPVLPRETALYPAYPNPFNATISLHYYLSQAGEVRLEVSNVVGQRMATLVTDKQRAGEHSVVWNAEAFASGVYIVQLRAGGQLLTQKIVLMK
ncbi:T9SS type A sorting domain-containing protein [candidate division KSB1 bacterium]|nr:T9SS type A sorting domain-containing protein [candidate division KSB1 bacterium]